MHVYRWCRNGAEFPSGWPQRALDLASDGARGDDGTIHIQNINRSARGNGMDVLARLGSTAGCAFRAPVAKGAGILGFDALQAGGLARWNESGLVHMAFDAIANAVRREILEQDKERLEASLHQARRMETIGALTSGIAHNFNNIVGAILGFAEMAHAHVKAGSRSANSLGEIRRAGERARDLVDQILTFGRRGAMRRERICVKELIAETRTLLEASLPHHVSLMVQETSDTTIVAAEPAQLQQVILNVCNNAAQAMDEAGTIEITLEARETESALRIGHDDLAAGRYTIISNNRHRTRHGRGDAGKNLRAVLHHATRRKRARPGDGTRDRPPARRSGQRAKQPWGGYRVSTYGFHVPCTVELARVKRRWPDGPRVRRDGAGA
jgi:signal transduction histidine kinase